MKVEQIYTNCLFQGSYVIESEGEIAIIDPLREPNQYIKKAKETNSKIKYIFETHIHADFVSGHLTLSKLTGAPIIFGPKAEIEYDCIIAEDFQEFKLGKISLQILHTPGHTLESCTILLKNHRNEKVSIFTGDTLFLGDVGRPDLSQWCPSRKSSKLNQNELAAMLFDSLRNKIMPLPDNLIVYPAHGAGSACGKNMMKETYDTLGNQKKVNYALREDMSKSEFIEEVLNGLESPPEYFPMNVKMNQTGYEDLSDIFKKSLVEMNPIEFDELSKKNNHLVLDVRNENDYVRGHIPKSIFIGLNGSFAPWVGTLIKNVEKPILLVAPLGKEKEAINTLEHINPNCRPNRSIVELTDELLKRCEGYKRKEDNGVLFKFSKQNQSDLIDIPLIGLDTIKSLKKYNYDGVFLQKNKCLILDKKKITDYANENNLFISSVELN